MRNLTKWIRRFAGILSLSIFLLLAVNLLILILVAAGQSPNSGPWTTARTVSDSLIQTADGYRLSEVAEAELRDKNSYGKVSDLRLETDKAYRSLVERINALALVNGEEEYADLITRWNTRIDAYRNAISRRLGAGKGGNTGGSENQPTEPTEPTEPEEPTDPDPEGERPGGL